MIRRFLSSAATAAIPKNAILNNDMALNMASPNPITISALNAEKSSVTSLLQLLSLNEKKGLGLGSKKVNHWQRNRVIAGWKVDSLLESLIAEGNMKDAVSIITGLKNIGHNKISNSGNGATTIECSAGVDSYTVAACIRGWLAFYENQDQNLVDDQKVEEVVEEEQRDFVQLVVDFVGRDIVELHELIVALHHTRLNTELESIFETWRLTDYDANHSSLSKSSFQQLDYSESKVIKTCNAFADYFAEKGDLATVVYITKRVFRLGILNQSHHLFQCQIKASGHSLSQYSPVMSIKQMENKGYAIDGKTMALFMQSMIPSGRYHAVYGTYKKVQALNESEEKRLAELADDKNLNLAAYTVKVDTCVEMIEALMDALVKECIIAVIDLTTASFPATEFTFHSSFYDAHLDILLSKFSAAKKANARIKTPHTKYAFVMFKYITSQRQKHDIKPSARLLYLDLLYALITSNTRIIYQILEDVTKRPDYTVEWKREEEEEWRRIHLIFSRLLLISQDSMFPSCFFRPG